MTRKLLPLGLLLLIVSACNNSSPTAPLVGFHRAVLTGVVKGGASGRPIANSVTVDVATFDGFHVLGESRTDGNGRYDIDDLPAGHWQLFVNTRYDVLARAEVDIHEGANSYDVVVPNF